MEARHLFRLLSLCLFPLMMAACAGTGLRTSLEREQDLKARVESYWNFRKAGDLYHSYDYEHVSYLKRVERNFYLSHFSRGLIIKGFKVLEIGREGSGPRGSTPVKIELTYAVAGLPFPTPREMHMVIQDPWIKEEDGQWYHLLTGINRLY